MYKEDNGTMVLDGKNDPMNGGEWANVLTAGSHMVHSFMTV